MTFLCLLGLHRTRLIEGSALALLGCVDCGQVELVWYVSRPEIANREARDHARVMAFRDRIVAEMTERNKAQNKRVIIGRINGVREW